MIKPVFVVHFEDYKSWKPNQLDQFDAPYSEAFYYQITKAWRVFKKEHNLRTTKQAVLTLDNMPFDSLYEMARYMQLSCYQDKGLINNLRRQPGPYTVWAPTSINKYHGKPRSITYTPDYEYVYNNVVIYEDAKGQPRIKESSTMRAKMLRDLLPNAMIIMVRNKMKFTLPDVKIHKTWREDRV